MTFVDARRRGVAPGLDVFGVLAEGEQVREALEADEVAGGEGEVPADIGANGADYVRYVLASMMSGVQVAPGLCE
eukprot:6204137-Pyramimonas_sp.AAC.1